MSNLTKDKISFQTLVLFVTIAFLHSVFSGTLLAQGLWINRLPQPGRMVNLSSDFNPLVVKGLKVYPQEPLRFDFIVDTGDSGMEDNLLEQEAMILFRYFLVALTMNDEDMWVNLSPFEKERVIPESFGQTEMGRDLLAQDYLLKQVTASLIYPENDLGVKFWDSVYEKAYTELGLTDVPVNTFNKVWIVPEKAVVFENDNSAFVIESRLKVMLEEDYLALRKQREAHGDETNKTVVDRQRRKPVQDSQKQIGADETTQLIREILIPVIEEEVNTGENFSTLRQIYHAIILASWYKRNLKDGVLGKVYCGRNKIQGVDLRDKEVANKIYRQYLEAFKVGVYNYVREEYNPATQEIIPKKYFSGGMQMDLTNFATDDQAMLIVRDKGQVSGLLDLIRSGYSGFKKFVVGLEEATQGQDASFPATVPVGSGMTRRSFLKAALTTTVAGLAITCLGCGTDPLFDAGDVKPMDSDPVDLQGQDIMVDALLSEITNRHGMLGYLSRDQLRRSILFSNDVQQVTNTQDVFQILTTPDENGESIFEEGTFMPMLFLEGLEGYSNVALAMPESGIIIASQAGYQDLINQGVDPMEWLAVKAAHEGHHILNYQVAPNMPVLEDEAIAYEFTYKAMSLFVDENSSPEQLATLEAQRKVWKAFEILSDNPERVTEIFELPVEAFGQINYLNIELIEENSVDVTLYNMRGGQEERVRVYLDTGEIDVLIQLLQTAPEQGNEEEAEDMDNAQLTKPDTVDDVSTADKAEPVGGIDLNTADLEIETRGGGVDFEFPEFELPLEDVEGFAPVIINVVPNFNMPMFLGMNEEEEATLEVSQAN
jgi:hypothetical protein